MAADAIERMKAANPSLLVCVDPILGDAGRLYVGQETAEAIRDRLVPLADVATPNLFELAWLTDTPAETATDIVRSACNFGPAMVVVTSAAHTAAGVGTLLVVRGSMPEHQTRTRSAIPNGAGDVLAGLFLGRLLRGRSRPKPRSAPAWPVWIRSSRPARVSPFSTLPPSTRLPHDLCARRTRPPERRAGFLPSRGGRRARADGGGAGGPADRQLAAVLAVRPVPRHACGRAGRSPFARQAVASLDQRRA